MVMEYKRRQKKKATKHPAVAEMVGVGGSKTMGKKKTSRRFSVANVASSEWQLVMDPDTGDQYYYNHDTGATQWETPESVANALSYSTKNPSVSIQKRRCSAKCSCNYR